MIIIKYFIKLFKTLQSDDRPQDIARGFVFGMVIGLTPIMSLHNLLFLTFIFIFRAHFSIAILGFGIFSGFAYLLDPLFHDLGFTILSLDSLQSIWKTVYNTPVIALSLFNNTVVMGSLIISLLLLIPMFYLMIWFVVYYRENLDGKIKKLKIIQIIKTSKLYGFYAKISGGL